MLKRKIPIKLSAIAIAAFAGSLVATQAGEVDIRLYGQFGTGTPTIEGQAVEDLTSASAFPDNPAIDSANPPEFFPLEPLSSLQWPQDEFVEGDNTGDDYGSAVEGYIEVPQDGEYTFYVRSDDASQLELSSDHTKANAEVIAEEPECCNDFVADGTRNSEPITLSKGEQYYFRFLHKEGTGGDWWQVGWTGPGIDEPTVIDGRFIQRYVESAVLEVVSAPEDTTVTEMSEVLLEASVRAQPPVEYQWNKDGTAIDGAINSSYSFEATLDDDGSTYSLDITSGGETTTAGPITLTVQPDTTAPELVSASTQGNPAGVTVEFSEAISEGTATTTGNYSISDGVSIDGASLVNPSTVQLETSEIAAGTVYTLTVNGVQDRAQTPNTIASDSTMDFLQVHGVITRHQFNGISGGAVSDLEGADKYPDDPDIVDFPTLFEGPVGAADNYGSRFRGFVTAPESGDYIFYINSDDQSELFLSTDDDPANATQVAAEPAWNDPREWIEGSNGGRDPDGDGNPNNISAPITLEAGQKVYIEALHKEGGGGDNISVAWKKPSDSEPTENADLQPIPGRFLSAFKTSGAVSITNAPTDTTVTELNSVSFVAEVDGTPPYDYQWLKEGEPIQGATSRELSFDQIALDDAGEYTVEVENQIGSDSASFQLTVDPDTTAPTVVSTLGSPTFTEVTVELSEEVTADSAENAGNYSFDKGLTVSSATLQDDGQTVVLTTSEQDPATIYTLTVSGVADLADAANEADTTAELISWQEINGLTRLFYNHSGGFIADIYTSPTDRSGPFAFPSGNEPFGDDAGANSTVLTDLFESPRGVADDYGAIMYGWVVPPESGDYTFYLSSDDNSQLWLSSDEDPANATQIANEPEWNGYRAWNTSDRRGSQQNVSDPISLESGQRYYVEAVFNEGGGGDGMEVTWQMPGEEAPADGDPSISADNLRTFVPANQAPAPWSISITSPEDLAQIEAGATDVTAEFADLADTPIERVELMVNGEVVGEATSSPYTISWNASTGRHELQVRAVDRLGRDATSDTIEVAAGNPEPPQVVSAGTTSGSGEVGVVFDGQVTEATATDTANFSIDGATITGASLDEAGRSVTLEVDGLPSGDFNVTVNGVEDKFGIGVPADSQVSVETPTLQNQDIGTDLGTDEADPIVEGTAQFFGDGNWDVRATGSDIWGVDDSFHFVYEEISGDFDKRVRVQELTHANDWVKGGIMAREDLTPGSRHVMNIATPPEGTDAVVPQERVETDGESQRWGGDGSLASDGVPLPNVWVRLQREGSTFTAYRSNDREDWEEISSVTRDGLPETLYVGLALTSHNNSEDGVALGQFRNYGDFVPPPDQPVVGISQDGGEVTISWDGGGTLQTAPSVTGPWSDSDQGSPATFSLDAQDSQFFRVQQ